MPIISFVILTYNSEKHIPKLFESLSNVFEATNKEVEFIVVDNNSTDKTVNLLREIKNIYLIENKENVGFSRGINIGAKKAKGEFLVFLNPDIQLEGGNIFEVVDSFKEDERVGAIGGAMEGKNGLEKSTGTFLKTWEIFLTMLGLDEASGIRKSPKDIQEVDFVSGGFMIVRKDIFQKIDGFDEKIFMYTEDMEFCYRLRKAGYKVLFYPAIKVFHESHGSSSRSFAIKNIYKGLLHFHKKHGNILSQVMVRIMLSVKAILLVIIGRMLNNKYLVSTYSEALRL